jgi:threonine 3-dehydrogenase
MMAVVKAAREPGYDYVAVPIPSPGPDEVLFRVERAAVCGTDILLHKWDPLVHSLISDLPFVPGHECCGTIVETGAAVEGLEAGMRVCAETHIPCGSCYQCTHGLQHICRNLILYGHHVDGCFAEYSVIPSRAVYPLQTDIPAELACLLEPFGVSLRGVQAAEPSGDSLLVNGCGPIGLFAMAIARHLGAERILAVDVNPRRLALAEELGADLCLDAGDTDAVAAILDATSGDGVGCAIEASGAPGAVTTCLQCLRKGGTIVVLGNPKAPVEIRDVMPDFMHKELTLHTLHGRRMFDTWVRAEKLLAERSVAIEAVTSHTFALSRISEAMAEIASGRACKVQLIPGE